MTFRISGRVLGVSDTIAAMAKANARSTAGLAVANKRIALGGQSIVRGKASGRPGPRNVTGDFRRSIVGQATGSGGLFEASIGTNAPQALRLEFGFSGPDALGRVYNQPPYPYFGPSVPEVEELARGEVTKAVGGAFG